MLGDAVGRANRTLLVPEVASFESYITSRRYPRRLSAIVLGACCVLTAWLACVGLYGLMSYATARRLHEFGVCIALGAQRPRILWMALRGGMTYAAVGMASGLFLGGAALVFMKRLVGEMPTLGAGAMLVVGCLLLLVIALASLGPTRLIASVDASRLLRQS